MQEDKKQHCIAQWHYFYRKFSNSPITINTLSLRRIGNRFSFKHSNSSMTNKKRNASFLFLSFKTFCLSFPKSYSRHPLLGQANGYGDLVHSRRSASYIWTVTLQAMWLYQETLVYSHRGPTAEPRICQTRKHLEARIGIRSRNAHARESVL